MRCSVHYVDSLCYCKCRNSHGSIVVVQCIRAILYVSYTTLSAYLDWYYIVLCSKFSVCVCVCVCVDTNCTPSAEELMCSEVSSYNPHYMVTVTLLFPVQSALIFTVLLVVCVILYWNTKKYIFHMFPQNSWAKEMIKHVTALSSL